MKILFFNQYYHPIKNPPAKRLFSFSKYLAKKGWKVTIITGMPNYPSGKLYKKYKRLFKKEKKEGIKIYRYYEIPAKIKGTIRPLVNYISFSLTSLCSWNKIKKADIVYISSPPVFSTITAFWMAQLFNKKIVLEIRDLYPESAQALGIIRKKSFVYKQFIKINKRMFKRADKIITINKEMAKEIKEKYNVKKVEVITNFASKKNNKNIKQKNKKIMIVFTGVLGKAQGLSDFLKKYNNKKIQSNVDFHIVGNGEDFSAIKRLTKSMKNIYLYGYQSKQFCDTIIKKADVGLISLKKNAVFEKALPSKFFEYLSFGKPILSNTSKVIKKYIKENDCGWFIEEKIPLLTKKAIMIKSQNAKRLFEKEFEEEIVCKKLEKLVK
ncbi:MAG: glycosyltransferase family 4 protein, partial [Candidatus Woesearchaeota archaeon]